LIDTPGIASVHAHNTQATQGFLPRIERRVFVTSPEPPLTSAERISSMTFTSRSRRSSWS